MVLVETGMIHIQSILCIHSGAKTDSTTFKFDATVHGLMMGMYATLKLIMWKDHNNKITVIGLYYISDGG
jgi:hypothetical protein